MKKSFLNQVNLKPASIDPTNILNSNNYTSTISKNSSSTNPNSDQDAICSEAKDYLNLMMEVEVSLKELMTAFEEHLKDIRLFKNSTDIPSEKEKWQFKERDIVDYYVNKTAELLDVYVNLNMTINQINSTYCAPKVVPVIPSKNTTNTVQNSTKNATNNSTTNTVQNSTNNKTNNNTNQNNTQTPTNNTTTNTTNPIKNNTTNSTSNNNSVLNNTTNSTSNASSNITDNNPNIVNNNTSNSTTNTQTKNNTSENNNTTPQNNNPNKEITDANKIDIKYDTHTQKEEMPKPATVEDTISSSGSQSNVITIFTERLQVAASEAGLTINYVQTRLREIMEKKEKIKLQKNLRRLKH